MKYSFDKIVRISQMTAGLAYHLGNYRIRYLLRLNCHIKLSRRSGPSLTNQNQLW
jgi:hypothetical protein